MRSLNELINICNYLGVELIINRQDKNSIQCKVPQGVSIENIKGDIKRHKASILKMLTNNARSNSIALEDNKNDKNINAHMAKRILEFGLTKEDVRGETDPSLALDPDELNDIRNNKHLFDIWIEHVHWHKQLRALEIAKQKQTEEYTTSETLGSLILDHRLKFIEHVLTTFKKFFLGERYTGQKTNEMFLEIWFEVNQALTLRQIFDGSAELIRLAKLFSKVGNNVEFKRLQSIFENAEWFRNFCVQEIKI